MDELTKRIQRIYEEKILEAGMKMTRQEAIKNLEKGVLSTPMLEPLGISMDSFLRFSQLPSTKQQELLKKMAKGFKSKDWKNPEMWKKLAKEGREILEADTTTGRWKEVKRMAKKYGFDMDLSVKQVDFTYAGKGKKISAVPEENERWVKIEIPYFTELFKAEKVQAGISHYHGDELLDHSQAVIYELKGLDTILRRAKQLVDKG